MNADTATDAVRAEVATLSERPGREGASAGALYWHASTRPTIERPSVAALLLVGWTVEHENPWGALMRRSEA